MAIPETGTYIGPRTFTAAVSICLTNYAEFNGRAPRSEYWFFELFIALAGLAGAIVDLVLFGMSYGFVGLVINLALLVPGLAVSVRRLHDIDRSGWWLLIVLIPLVGVVLLLVWACTRGTAGPNRFGADPLAGAAGPQA